MKKIILGIIIGVIISGTVGVIAATIVPSTIVTYQNKTVNNALDELYNEAITGKELVAAAITNKGVSTTSTDTYETMATNISSIDTDHTEINQKINNLESKHNSDIASITGIISNLNQNVLNIELIWENANPKSSFGKQTIIMNKEYDIIICISDLISTIVIQNVSARLIYTASYASGQGFGFYDQNRDILAEGNKLTIFDNRSRIIVNSGNVLFDGVNNNSNIPLKIYGIKLT